MSDIVTLTISLPVHGTGLDYAQAISGAICQNPDAFAQSALSNLLSHLHYERPAGYVEGTTQLVYGKGAAP